MPSVDVDKYYSLTNHQKMVELFLHVFQVVLNNPKLKEKINLNNKI